MSDPVLSRLDALIALMQASKIPVQVDLWDAEMIAAYLKRSREQVLNRVTKSPGFPKPIRICGNGHPLWKAREIIAWAEMQQAA